MKILLKFAAVFSCVLFAYSCFAEPFAQSYSRLGEGKPGASVELISPRIVQTFAQQTTAFDLVLSVPESSSLVTLEINPDASLSMSETPRVQEFIATPVPLRVPLKFMPVTDGRFHLNVNVTLKNKQGVTSSRSLAVIVQVGKEPLAAPVSYYKPKDVNVVSLPALETISTD